MLGGPDPGVPGGGQARRLLAAEGDPRALGGDAAHDRPDRAIIDDDDLLGRSGLGEQRIEAASQLLRPVARADDHRDRPDARRACEAIFGAGDEVVLDRALGEGGDPLRRTAAALKEDMPDRDVFPPEDHHAALEGAWLDPVRKRRGEVDMHDAAARLRPDPLLPARRGRNANRQARRGRRHHGRRSLAACQRAETTAARLPPIGWTGPPITRALPYQRATKSPTGALGEF